MKNYFINNSIKLVTQYKSFSKDDIEKLKYGLEGLYLTITKLIIIIIISILLGITKELIILLILFNIIRYPAFGFHANKSFQCLIFSSLLFIGLPCFLLNISISRICIISIYILSLISFLLFAPADTEKRPLYNKKKRIIRKIVSIVILIIYIILCEYISNEMIIKLLLLSMIIESIIINPTIYAIFKMPYNNYKRNDSSSNC